MTLQIDAITPSNEQKAGLVGRVMGVAGLALIAATSPLWTSQQDFPEIPFFRWAGVLPGWCDWTLLALMVASLLTVIATPAAGRLQRVALATFAAAAAGSILLDQHRLQPWMYQFVVMAVVLAMSPDARGVWLLRMLVIGIYGHSALSKLDWCFLESNGQQLLSGLLQNFGLTIADWPPAALRFGAALLPAGELAVAALLCVPRLWRWGLAGSIVMHVFLLMAVGPWGLNHQPGVLLWNVYFIVQNVLLFRRRTGIFPVQSQPTECASRTRSVRARMAEFVAGAAILLPFLEPFGLFDHWPAWALYASRPGRADVYVHESRRGGLPPELLPFVDEPRFDSPWCRTRLDRWSLAAVDAPIYPQVRFQLGVALEFARRCELYGDLRVVVEEDADRWTGVRASRELIGRDEVRVQLDRFWLNALPRDEN